ncbi:MAG TPA: CDGSH iron-sulfur domain-containing protein [Kiritimatiellia bacterium]|nr:CDGSH iron-sulfur domain-containing protein [Kiritimatiellia bacterium]
MSKPEIAGRNPICEEMKPGTYWWCSCGKSQSQPFCDGSHKGSEFQPFEVEVVEERSVAWCACKRTGTPPFCDGSHKYLPPA